MRQCVAASRRFPPIAESLPVTAPKVERSPTESLPAQACPCDDSGPSHAHKCARVRMRTIPVVQAASLKRIQKDNCRLAACVTARQPLNASEMICRIERSASRIVSLLSPSCRSVNVIGTSENFEP